jgi:hypothetical protein
MGAPPCAAGTPAINIVYPSDGVLVPPNMNVISIHWTPFGTPFTEFEVDFENSVTDMRVATTCAAQTMDTEQPPQPSGGCELALSPAMWQAVANQNRGGDAVTITVRGTTNGMCASPSANTVRLSFAQEDLLGAIYYWKSTVTANQGTGGEIWVKSFGDSVPEQDITTPLGLGTCNGCHALSRDGLRMVINSDDNDSDDEYGDIGATLIDMTAGMPIGGTGNRGRGPMNPSFGTFYPDHTQFLMSNGLAGAMPPTNVLFLYDGNTDNLLSTLMNVGSAAQVATMPDWSPDGKSVIFVIPQKVGSWQGSRQGARNDDDHVFGGSLYTMPYSGNMQFGAPTLFLMSGGENNYYPGYSPDGQLVVFDRVAQDTSVPTIDGCVTTPNASCPNDSFSNPKARLMLTKNMPGSTPIDLENANGSPAAMPVSFSNSWPKWSPFLNNYKNDKLLWIAFSSTRDYGLRVRNHQSGMYQCYPPDSLELPGAAHGSTFAPQCQQPQLWMAAIDVTVAVNQKGISPHVARDPSRLAFWLPFQDITTHNHTPQWTQRVAPPPDAGAPVCVMASGACGANGTCCAGLYCTAASTCQPIPQ